MDFDKDFNGEINVKLSNYKIPLKTTTPKSDGDSKNGDRDNVEVPEQTFISPLSILSENETSPYACDNTERKSWPQFPKMDFPPPLKRKAEDKPIFYGRDSSYPDELNDLIQPLTCKLCSVNLNSAKTAKWHYESKTHCKKINNWLMEWSKISGKPAPKIQKVLSTPARDVPTGPNAFHCEACDLPLTSVQHAAQHYGGKRHRLVVASISKPTGAGYYDNAGKWIRTAEQGCNIQSNNNWGSFPYYYRALLYIEKPKNMPKQKVMAVGTKLAAKTTYPRFGIGESFLKPAEKEEVAITEVIKTPDSSKTCDICQVTVTSEQQMETHLQGARHAKKLKSLEQPPYAAANDTILASVKCKQIERTDLSMYRTPSGSYYCKTCNVSVSEATHLTHHLESKKHSKNLKTNVKNK